MKPKTYIENLTRVLNSIEIEDLQRCINLIREAWKNGNQIFFLGNGGSALTALHIVTDLNKSVLLKTGKRFLGRTLLDNIGLITAYSNDISYEDLFVEQLKGQMNPNDVVIGISGSGNSENVIRAIKYANSHGGITIGLIGYDGGKLISLTENSLWVNVNDMQFAEDIHMIFGHMVMKELTATNE